MKYSLFLSILAIPLAVFSQTPTVKVPLKLEKSNSFDVKWTIAKLKFDEKEMAQKTSSGLTASVIRSANDPNVFSITIDQNNDQNLKDETPFDLALNSKKVITLATKTKTGQVSNREFEIFAERDEETKTDYVHRKPNYSAKGIFKYRGCQLPITLFDLNLDGIFTIEEPGSSVGIDRNKDGKTGGKGEFAVPTEIIDLCGKNFLITNINNNGSLLSFRRTNLQNAKIFGLSPQFSLQSVTAKSISSHNLKGTPYLLDFWATWCGICIEKMPEIKQMEGALPIIYFNTDTIDRKREALALANKLEISANTILRIFPNADNFYKSYQRMESGLPFYVLIDGEGIIRYGGNGGDNLKELKGKISELKKLK